MYFSFKFKNSSTNEYLVRHYEHSIHYYKEGLFVYVLSMFGIVRRSLMKYTSVILSTLFNFNMILVIITYCPYFKGETSREV